MSLLSKYRSLCVAVVLMSLPAISRSESPPPEKSPAQTKIDVAERRLENEPTNIRIMNQLALAQAERARETANPDFYAKARQVIDRALALDAESFETRKSLCWVLLGQHEFAEAKTIAESLQRQVPDDLMVYGMLTDAYVELGQYEAAEKACQWMLDMRPDSVPALARGAYLRELFGDVNGAIELMLMAHNQTPHREREYRAWALCQLAHLLMLEGKLELADTKLGEADATFPGYHYVIAAQAKLAELKGDGATAVQKWTTLTNLAPHPENFYYLGRALQDSGDTDKANKAFETFVNGAIEESRNADNANNDLVDYFCEVAGDPSEAMRVATLAFNQRQDLQTRAGYAWALFHADRTEEATDQIQQVLDVGTQDPELAMRAARIFARAGKTQAAIEQFSKVVHSQPTSHRAKLARVELQTLASKK